VAVAHGLPSKENAPGGVSPQGNLGTVDAKDARIAAGSAAGCYDGVAGQETKFHEPARKILWKIQTVDDTVIAFPQIGEPVGVGTRPALDTQLHDNSSIRPVNL
jgi:hypothetical protein